jgi:hypothetical protein
MAWPIGSILREACSLGTRNRRRDDGFVYVFLHFVRTWGVWSSAGALTSKIELLVTKLIRLIG